MKSRSTCLSVLLCVLLASCGGGGGGDGSLDGGVVKGPVLGATVCAFALSGGAKGAALTLTPDAGATGSMSGSCYVTGATGSYNFRVNHAGEVLIESTGGRYCTDELPIAGGACQAGGSIVNMTETMTAVARVGGNRSSVYVTPLTTAAVNVALRAGNLTVDAFEGRFATLAGAVLGNSRVTPADVPTVATQAYLQTVATHMAGGGSLADAVEELEANAGSGGGGIPAGTVAATVNAALVGSRNLYFSREGDCASIAICPYGQNDPVTVEIHTDGRMVLPGGKTLRNPFHRKIYGETFTNQVIWRDSFGVEFAVGDNGGGLYTPGFSEIVVGDGNRIEPAGYALEIGKLSLP